MHCRPVLTFLSSPKLVACYYFLLKKNWISFISIPYFRVLPTRIVTDLSTGVQSALHAGGGMDGEANIGWHDQQKYNANTSAKRHSLPTQQFSGFCHLSNWKSDNWTTVSVLFQLHLCLSRAKRMWTVPKIVAKGNKLFWISVQLSSLLRDCLFQNKFLQIIENKINDSATTYNVIMVGINSLLPEPSAGLRSGVILRRRRSLDLSPLADTMVAAVRVHIVCEQKDVLNKANILRTATHWIRLRRPHTPLICNP